MTALYTCSVTCIRSLLAQMREHLRQQPTLEQAAQRCVSLFYEEFPESVVLVRLYATLPFGRLPEDVSDFAAKVARAKDEVTPLHVDAPVLTLLGSRGVRPAWTSRRRSAGHVGIPLLSARSVSTIPMVARLLEEMGLHLEGCDNQPGGLTSKLIDCGMSGVFFVADARVTVDEKGRQVIPAQLFVEEHRIKTVFGLGGSYMGGVFVTLIAFTRESIERAQVVRFTPLINVFKAATVSLVLRQQFFA